MSFKTAGVISALAGAASVAAHGHVNSIIADGVEYDAFSLDYAYTDSPPTVVGWATTALDNGFILPEGYTTDDIICHKDATNAGGHAAVKAGGEIFLQWDQWPDSHKGPVIDMLAPCGDDCSSVDKTGLEFFKIQEVGLVSGAGAEGTWASDQLIANGNGWLVQIPETLKAGRYVLRHEIIGHHESFEGGAQNYPQCINIEVTGGGDDLPEGVVGTELYTPDHPGIAVNIYNGLTDYEMPGPAAPSIASVVEQRVVTADSQGEPIVGEGSPSPVTPEEPATTSAVTTPIEEEDNTTIPETPSEDDNTTTPIEEEDEEEDYEDEFEECPAARRRRMRREARAARRHARRA